MDFRVKPQILGLNPMEAGRAAEELNRYLANLQVMFIKLHNLHWNVVGTNFFDIHEKTEVLYDHVFEEIDLIAERIKMIGFYPVGSLSDALNVSTIEELPTEIELNGPTVASVIVKDLRTLITQLRKINETVDAAYTSGLTDDALYFYEKYHWLFSAYLTYD